MAVRDQEDTSTTVNSPTGTGSSVGQSIVNSLRGSVERMKTDVNPASYGAGLHHPSLIEETAPMQVSDIPVPDRHGSKSVKVASDSAAGPKTATVKPVMPRPKPTTRQSRRARLRISRVDPWSVMKTALLFGVAAWIIFIIATWIVFTVLGMTGLYDAINSAFTQIFSSPDVATAFDVQNYINTTRATALAALIGAVNVIITTALATIFAFLYNLSAVVMGGIEVTMAED